MKALAVGRPTNAEDARRAIAPFARAELEALWRLYASGTVREMYSPGGPGAVLVLDTESLDSAHEALAVLRLVANGIIRFELTLLLPFTAFATLFGETRQE